MFLSVAARQPDSIAVESGADRLTYRDLERLVRRYAAAFAVVPAPCILIALPRGADAYASILAAGLAGGFYAPVNEASPPEKLLNIAARLEPDIIVAAADTGRRLAASAPRALCIDPAHLPSEAAFTGDGTRHATAYVIFTSGSTGQPKGVVISRRALNHYVGWVGGSHSVLASDRVAQYNNLAFDVSVFDIYGALCLGATLVPIDGKVDRLFPARAVARERITVWASVPSVISLMMSAGDVTWANLNTIRLFTFAGEPLFREHVEAIFAACPHAVVQNSYGPTETTVTMTEILLLPERYLHACGGPSVSIGPPIRGMQIHLLGGASADEGEIVITGPQVADGYWRDPERTAGVFREITLDGMTALRYYSGDWAERRDGLLYFKERIDFQVKIRGYRIELEEVAGAIRQCGWPILCVFKWRESLVALVECEDDQGFDAASLRVALAGHLEAYAIPEEIHRVDKLPRNENDKIDRKLAARMFEALAPDAG
jgi:D-alanine--poly(phosphoribitol) ligase subunit 1